MPDDLTDDDKAILAELLREPIGRGRFPLSPRVRRLKAAVAKISPSAAAPPKPSVVVTKRRRR